MKHKTRKFIFTALAAILASFLFTCIPFGPPDYYEDEYIWTDVEYSPDGNSVTIYLDGSRPVLQSRALNLRWAQVGHDLFEVVFAYNHGSNQYTVARSVWETGHAAGISGVYRTADGVDYQNVRNVNSMSTGEGSAILFIGKKSDRTLLAVGKLAQVDGIGDPGDPGDPSADPPRPPVPPIPIPNITTATKTVTFSAAALKTGTSNNAATSSFKTDALLVAPPGSTDYSGVIDTNTEVFSVTIGLKPFPLFWLGTGTPARYVHGLYLFGVNTGPNDFALYGQGILLQTHTQASMVIYQPGPNPSSEAPTTPRIPRYPAGEDKWETSMTGFVELQVDASTAVLAENNLYAAAATPVPVFDNPVRFRIGQTNSGRNGEVFAFSFEIPVIPLTAIDNRANSFLWYLRPGYDSYKYDLDDGVGNGGAILLGTGTFDRSASSDLFVRKSPAKTRYPGTGTPTTADWLFSLTDIEVNLRRGGNVIDVTDASTLYYVVNNRSITPGTNIQAILEASESSGGIVTVRLEYYDPAAMGTGGLPFLSTGERNNSGPSQYNGDDPYVGELLIYYIPVPPGLNFGSIQGSYVITNTEDWLRFQNGPVNGTAGTYIVVFFENVNIGSDLNIPAGRNVILLAGKPNIVIGKAAGLAQVFTDQSTVGAPNTYYFGIWPFDEILSVNGMAVDSQRFIINAGGTYNVVNTTVSPPTAPAGTGTFITGANARVYDSGVIVLNTLR